MSSDSLLIIGEIEKRLDSFLQKMGFSVHQTCAQQQITELLGSNTFDLILIDSRLDMDWAELCRFFRTEEVTSRVPIILLAGDSAQMRVLKNQSFHAIEFVDPTSSAGMLAGKIAMQLRLRKFTGAESKNASLAEMNTALRDLNKRLAAQMEEGRQIQQSLLPAELPQDERFELSSVYTPFDELGGDWYGVYKEPSGKISVQIADVTGHGLSAALICSMTKLAKSAAGREDPAEMFETMNRLLTPVMPSGRFVTASSYLYDPASGALSFARAGHLPALVLKRGTGEVLQLKAEGFAFGFMDDGTYQSDEVVLEVNDLVMLFTDGISEAQDRKFELYGMERLAQSLIQSKPAESASAVLQRVFDDFDAFRDGRIVKDDITVVILKRVK